jgi:uncharacterized protein DUF4136
MRMRLCAVGTAALLLLSVNSRAQPYNLRTMAAPKAAITQFRSFHLLPPPLRRDGARTGGDYDPMQNRSAANRVLRRIVADEFVDRGYFDSEWMPDFVVAIYASARDPLDLSIWEYGYGSLPRWWSEGSAATATSFEPGTVVIDVINAQSLEVLWRGAATARMGTNDLANTNALLQTAIAIVDRFPRAKPIVVASHGRAPR